ncbi:MAG TPA: peptidylprolyl isomerase [Nitrososphaerales archaeon]|nr:peptidylprolyl isomerase [Nitrososphaerales archaeon]
MPHSSKKYKKPGAVPSSRAKWYVLTVVVAILVILPSLYLTYPPFASGMQSFFGGTQSSTATSSQSPATTSSNSTVCDCVYALIDTSQGTIEIELFQSLTPKTVNNFVSLANSGFYNNLVWHRIVKGFVIQTGDPNTRNAGGSQTTWGNGGSNTSVPLESVPSLHNDVGYVAMAHTSQSTSATSQFYINLANNTSLDGQYTVFGKVISCMSAVLAIGNLPVNSNGIPLNPSQAMMISVTIQSSP